MLCRSGVVLCRSGVVLCRSGASNTRTKVSAQHAIQYSVVRCGRLTLSVSRQYSWSDIVSDTACPLHLNS